MDRGNVRQTSIIRVEGGGYKREAWHQARGEKFSLMGAAQQPLDFGTVPHNETPVPPLNERRAPENKAVLGNGGADIVLAALC
jgi:hypothetical protein